MKDLIVFREERVAIEWSEKFQKYVISIPVRNDLVEYSEEYEITEEEFDHFASPEGYKDLMALAAKCRARQNDEKLQEKPGRQRGWPC